MWSDVVVELITIILSNRKWPLDYPYHFLTTLTLDLNSRIDDTEDYKSITSDIDELDIDIDFVTSYTYFFV